jgi:hypothetical protein
MNMQQFIRLRGAHSYLRETFTRQNDERNRCQHTYIPHLMTEVSKEILHIFLK